MVKVHHLTGLSPASNSVTNCLQHQTTHNALGLGRSPGCRVRNGLRGGNDERGTFITTIRDLGSHVFQRLNPDEVEPTVAVVVAQIPVDTTGVTMFRP